MKKLLTILFLVPFLASAQLSHLDSLLNQKLIGQGLYIKKVIELFGGQIAGKADTGTVSVSEVDPVFVAHIAHSLTGDNINQWDSAYYWGNHAVAGYLTSFTETDPTFLSHLAHSLTGTDTAHWNQAYLWGNHALAGYLTSFTETDPVFIAHLAHAISATDTAHWNQAYLWGNHTTPGYLTAATGLVKADTARHGSIYLAADFTTSSTTAVATNLSFPIGAYEMYKVMVTGTASKATSGSGLKVAINAPSGCSIKGFQTGGGTSLSTAMTNSLVTAINTLGTTFATGVGVEVPFVLQVTVENGATPGNITLAAATVTSNVATIYKYTSLTYTKSLPL